MSVTAVHARIAEIQGRFSVPSVPVPVSAQVSPASSPTFGEQLDVAKATTWGSTGTAAPTLPGNASALSAQRSSGATTPDATGERVVALAKQHLGTPYVWGGESPGGFDCSGLLQWAYKQVGIDLPRVSTQQAKAGREVSAAEARPGDLVFFERGKVDHIGMYAGDGKWVVAPKTGDVVKLQDVDLSKATTIRRVLPDAPAAATASAGGTTPYAALFAKAGAQHGVSPALLTAVARAESGFDAGARSPAGAQGLMQLMPATAKSLGVDPLQPAQAVDGAARLLKSHLQRFGATELALAAYNAGPGAVAKHGGVPPYAETKAYVARVMAELRGGGK
jgi:cell wall-associated NlpC family hydrolase